MVRWLACTPCVSGATKPTKKTLYHTASQLRNKFQACRCQRQPSIRCPHTLYSKHCRTRARTHTHTQRERDRAGPIHLSRCAVFVAIVAGIILERAGIKVLPRLHRSTVAKLRGRTLAGTTFQAQHSDAVVCPFLSLWSWVSIQRLLLSLCRARLAFKAPGPT